MNLRFWRILQGLRNHPNKVNYIWHSFNDKYIVSFQKLLVHMWFKVVLFYRVQWNWVLHFPIVLIIRVDWFWVNCPLPFSPSKERLAVYHDGLLIIFALTFSAGALSHWFYIIFSHVNISGIGMYLIIIDIFEWMQ